MMLAMHDYIAAAMAVKVLLRDPVHIAHTFIFDHSCMHISAVSCI